MLRGRWSLPPYDMLFAMAATALYLAVQYWEDRGFCPNIVLRAVPILTGVPFLAYNYWIFKIHPIFRWWSLPGGNAPAVWTTALSFGLTFLLLLFALWRLRGRRLGQAGRFNDLQSSERNSVHSPPLSVPLRVLVCNQHLEGPITKWRADRRWVRGCIVVLLLVNSATSISVDRPGCAIGCEG